MRLQDICEINPRIPRIDDDTEVSFVPMTSVSEDGEIDTSDIRPYIDVKKGYTSFKEDDVLFAKITPCMENGKGAIARGLKNGYGCGSSEFHVLRTKGQVMPEWIYYLTSWSYFRREAEKHMTGSAGQRRVPKLYLENYEIRLPELSDQEYQVQTLTHIKEVIDYRKAELVAFEELTKARFIEMFGDPILNSKHLETKELKEVLTLKAGDFTAASDISNEPSEMKPYPCYGGNGIRGYVSDYNQDGEYSLVGRQGALSGNVQFARSKFKNTEHALLVTPIIEMNSIWLNQLLQNLDLKRFQTGAAQPGLSVKNLQNIPIICVPIDEQRRFAEYIGIVDKSKLLEERQVGFIAKISQKPGRQIKLLSI